MDVIKIIIIIKKRTHCKMNINRIKICKILKIALIKISNIKFK
jgi:hypothetical protein